MQLASGKTVDLETIGTGGLAFWGIVWGLVGLAWLLYWIVPKRTVTRLPVTTQIPLNTDGMAYGLITKRDHRWMNVIVAVTLGLLAAGWIYQANAYPNKMPLQVLRFEPPAAATAATFVEAKPTSASYDPRTNTVSVTADVHNLGKTAATIEAFTTTTLTWTAQGAGAAGNKIMTVSPSPTVAAGQRSTLTLKITDPAWHDERLMPLNESRLQLTGVLRIKDESGAENFVNLQSFVTPTTT